MTDFSDWLTEKQVAEVLHVSERDVQRYLPGEGVKPRQQRSPEGQQPIWVYDPAIVEAIRASFDKPSLEANPRLHDLVFENRSFIACIHPLDIRPRFGIKCSALLQRCGRVVIPKVSHLPNRRSSQMPQSN